MTKNIKLIALVAIFGVSAYFSAGFYGDYLESRGNEEVIEEYNDNFRTDNSLIHASGTVDINF